MTTFRCDITMDNAAFEDGVELPELLRKVAGDVEFGNQDGSIRDSNGNRVGTWQIDEDETWRLEVEVAPGQTITLVLVNQQSYDLAVAAATKHNIPIKEHHT